VFAIAASLLIPAARAAYEPRHLLWNSPQNINNEVAEALGKLGVHPGDPVARISTGGFLGWARAAGVTIVAEVDLDAGAAQFWKSDPATQARVLEALRETGVKSIVGHSWDDVTAPGWHRVRKSHYWIYPVSLRLRSLEFCVSQPELCDVRTSRSLNCTHVQARRFW